MNTLRPYQRQAVRAVEKAWAAGVRRPAIVMATGLGKTHVFAELCRKEAKAGRRTLVLVHRRELLDQAYEKVWSAGGVRVGRLIAGLDDTREADVVIASVQTIGRRLGNWAHDHFDLVIVDEAHHASAASYRRIMEHFGCYVGSTRSLGVTATLARTDKRGLGDVWDDVVFKLETAWGIENDHLVSRVDAKIAVVSDLNLDTANVRTQAGDLHIGDLARAVAQSDAANVVARTYRQHAMGADRKPRRGIVFCPGVAVAEAFLEAFRVQKIKAAIVTGDTPTELRDQIYQAVRDGEIRVIVNCMVLTEGFDLPEVEVVVIARPTRSTPLYVQMAGRALRKAGGKESALILDVCGRTARKGLATPIDLSLPQEATRTWSQGDIERWDPPPAPEKLKMREIDAITGILIGMPALDSQINRLTKWGVKIPEGCTAAQAHELQKARFAEMGGKV